MSSIILHLSVSFFCIDLSCNPLSVILFSINKKAVLNFVCIIFLFFLFSINFTCLRSTINFGLEFVFLNK